VFLRVDTDPAELCVGCHANKTAADRPGHPLKPLGKALPAELAAAHGHTHGADRRMTCLTCHNAHGGGQQLLLDLPGSESSLCLSCHTDYRIQANARRPDGLHPIDVALTAERSATVRAAGGRVGEADLLVCSSCHAMHDAATPANLLRTEPTGSANCRACHTDQATVLDTVHNLAATHPEVTNAAGVVVGDAGACSACHMVHRRAIEGEARLENDPLVRCTPCHSEDRIAASHALSHVNHRGATCYECHNPHDDRHGAFLEQPAGALCRSCHSGYDTFVGGPHDIRRNADHWPAASRDSMGDCLACHRPHGTPETGLFRNGLAAGQPAADGACIQCHRDAAWGGPTAIAALHPRVDASGRNAAALPLGAGGAIECATCHNPHAGAEQRGLLRPGNAATMGEHALCLSCHSDLTTLHASAHTPAEMKAAGLDAFACGPCHQAHGSGSAAGAEKLFGAAVLLATPTTGATDDRYCIGCHRPAGPARMPAIATHPDVPMSVRLTDANALPLFDAAGQPSSNGKMTCRTCHTPHGREPAASGSAATISEAELRAQRNLVRPFGTTNLCIDCHGFEGYSRFLYFHDPQRRRGGSNQDSIPALWKPRPGK
jgi:predicted CXXCH cytochrome family protein